MKSGTARELTGLFQDDGVLAEIRGEIDAPAGFPPSSGAPELMRAKQDSASPRRRDPAAAESNGRCQFEATIRLSQPLATSMVNACSELSAMEFGYGAVGPQRPSANGVLWDRSGWLRGLLDRLPEPTFLLDPHDPELLGPVVECNEWISGQKGPPRKCVWSLGWPVIESNEAAGRETGYAHDDLVDQPAGLIGPRTSEPGVLASLLERLEREDVVRIKGFDQRKDGTFFPVEVSHVLVNLFGRELVLSIHADQTEHRRVEEEYEKMAASIRLNPHPILEFNEAGELTYSNGAAQELAAALGEKGPSAILLPGTAKIVRECLATGRGKMNCVTQVEDHCLCWSFYPIVPSRVVYAHAIHLTDRLESARIGPPVSNRPILGPGMNEEVPGSREWPVSSQESSAAAAKDATAPVEPGSAENSRVGEMLSLIRELTETVKKDRAQPSEMEKEALIGDEWWQATPDALITLDKEGAIISVNPAAERLTGYRADEILGLHVSKTQLLQEGWFEDTVQSQDSQSGAPGARLEELELLRKNQNRIWVEASLSASSAKGGNGRVHLALRDITARKQAERALRKSEASLSQAQRISRIGSWELDWATGALEWSEETCRLFGCPPDAIVSTVEQFYELVHPLHRDLIKQTREQAGSHRSPYNLEYRVVRADGSEGWIFEQADLICAEAGNPCKWIGTVQDISKRKQYEDQLRQVEKWEAIGRLAGGVAHDFNSILTDIRRCAKTIESLPNIEPDVAQQVKQLSAAAQRATNLTWHLLAYTRRQALDLKPVDVNDVIKHVAQTLQRALETEITLQLKLTPDLPAISIDVNMLEQVLLNLAVNARQTVPHGGSLTFETRVAEIDAGYVLQQPEARPGRHVCVSITDTGSGVDTATTACLFEPFFTSKEAGPGPGLGLATVYGIVRQHQGWIDVISGLRHGKTFTIYLPAQTTKPESITAETTARPMWGGTETILLVEDDPLLRALAESILERYGYRIFATGSTAEALSVWEKDSAEIDLILTNMILPGGTLGRDFAQQCETQKPELKTLFASNYNLNMARAHGHLKLGVNFLPKPYSATALAQAVRRCLDADGAASETVQLKRSEVAAPPGLSTSGGEGRGGVMD